MMPATAPNFDPANFTTEIDNPFMPLDGGTTLIYKSPDGSTVDTFQVTERTKVVDGVRCVVVHDTTRVDGQLEEDTLDYFAQDKQGNVWYFGEDTKQIENGHVVGTEGSFRSGVDGARAGIIMEAHPKVGDSYQQEAAPGVAEDQALVLSLNASAKVPFGSFNHLLLTKETTPLEPTALENKYYKAGIGVVLTIDKVTGDREELVAVRTDDHPGRTFTNVSQLVQAMATFDGGAPGHDSIFSGYQHQDPGLHSSLIAHGHHA